MSGASVKHGPPAEHQDLGAPFPEPGDLLTQQKDPPVQQAVLPARCEHFAWRNGVGMTLWHGVPLSLPIGGLPAVHGFSHSILEPLTLAERLKPKVLHS